MSDTGHDTATPASLEDADCLDLVPPFTLKELGTVLRDLHYGKAAEADGMVAEMFKYSNVPLQKYLLNLFYLVDFFKHIRKHAFTQTSKTPRTFSFYTSTGEVKPHVTLDGWARHSAPGLSLVNHKLNNFCMYSLDTICTEGYYFTQRAIGHIQFLTQPWCQLILGVVREIIIGI